jgi:hypothetical protein
MPRYRIYRPERGIGFSWILQMKILVLMLVLVGWSLQMQGQVRGFLFLTGPEKCWVLGHLQVASKARYLSFLAPQMADSVRKKSFMDANWNGGLADAFRHSLWMAMLTREIGAKKAGSLGRAHEKGNYRTWKKSQLEDGGLADATATEMDLWNNAQGIEIAEELGKDASDSLLIEAILDRMAEGKMRVIRKDSLGNFLDMDGKAIPDKNWKGLWENPRTLAPSRLVGKPEE